MKFRFYSEPQKAHVPNSCLKVYYTVSAKCLLKAFTTVQLPYRLDTLMNTIRSTTLDKRHFQLKWKELFTTYDLPDNAELQCFGPISDTLDILRPIRHKKEILKEGIVPGQPPILVKIIQFYQSEDDLGYYWNNPAIVTYYYDDTFLCKFDVFYELKQSSYEVEALAERYDASQDEKEQLIGYWLTGGNIYSNPEEIRDFSKKAVDYLDYLRMEPFYYEEPPEMSAAAMPGNAGRSAPALLDEDDDDDALPF